MAQFRVRIPSGVLELVNVETGQVLTLSADQHPIDLGVVTWEWGSVSVPKEPAEAEVPQPLPTQETSQSQATLLNKETTPPPSTPEFLPLGPLPGVAAPAMKPPAARPYMPLLDAPLEALTEEDFVHYFTQKSQDRGQWYWDEDDEATFVAVEARYGLWKQTSSRSAHLEHDFDDLL